MSPSVYGFSDLFHALRMLVLGLLFVWIPCGGMILLLVKTDASGVPLAIALFVLIGAIGTCGIFRLSWDEAWGTLKHWGERRYSLKDGRRIYEDEL